MNDTSHRLLIQSGPNAGQEYQLVAPSITIGRYPLADIVINDPDIAYRHALLTRDDTSYRIADLGSDSGTYVNGERVGAEPIALAHGDIILLGSRLSATYLEHAIETAIDEYPAAVTSLVSKTEVSDGGEGVVELNGLDHSGATNGDEYEPPVVEERVVSSESSPVTAEHPVLTEPAHIEHHPGPMPAMPAPQKNKPGRIILIATGCMIALLACCCSTTLFMYFIGGDWLLRQLGYLP